MVLKFNECVNGIFFNKLLDVKFMLFILDMDKNELYPFIDMLKNEHYLSSREIDDKEELTFRFDDKELYLSFDENRFVPMLCFSEFTENNLHLVKTMKYAHSFKNKHFKLALESVMKKLIDMYVYDVSNDDPRIDITSYYMTSYVFDYNPKVFRLNTEDVTLEIENFVDIIPREKHQIQQFFKNAERSRIYSVSGLENKKIISSIALVYKDARIMFKLEVEEDGVPTKSVWTSYVENEEKSFIKACEKVDEFLNKMYDIIGFEMTIEEFMIVLHGENNE